MILYLLKSTSCLALLLFFYYFVLEKEKMHNFNRFYLLGSAVFSFLVPLATVTIPVTSKTIKTGQHFNQPILVENTTSILIKESLDYEQLFIGVYFLIAAILFVRFGRNLFKIIQKIKLNEKIKHQKATLILVEDSILPHTFWTSIFINKEHYKKGKIEQELFTHELTHVTQKHTLDVLLIELLQIIFWINPLFIFLKKAIQLNHEFLADQTVINQYKNTFHYQYLLLNKAAWNNEYYLASNLNYSLTKKRLEMMTTQSSQTKTLLKKLTVIPLVIGFIFLFAERVEAQELQEKIETSKIEKVKTGFKILNGVNHYYVRINNTIKYYNKNGFLVNSNGELISNKKANSSEIIPKSYVTKVYFYGNVFCEFYNDKKLFNTETTLEENKDTIHNVHKNLPVLTEEILPPPPISPLDYIKKDKGRNVDYFYNRKKINYKKALRLLENNRPINIISNEVDGKMVINLSKTPIIIEN